MSTEARKARTIHAPTPRLFESGDSRAQLGITKAGDRTARRLLVGAAQYMLGLFGEDSDLRTFGLELAKRGGKAAKKRAVVAVARKLAVRLHALWIKNGTYQPFRDPPSSELNEQRQWEGRCGPVAAAAGNGRTA